MVMFFFCPNQALSQSKKRIVLLLMAFLCGGAPVFAQQDNHLENELDLGMLLYNGNNNATHLNGSLLSEYQRLAFENSFRITGLLSVGKNNRTKYKERNAEKYTVTEAIHYTFSPQHFAYIRGEGVKDHFSAYNYEITESIGYGYSVFNSENFRWEMSGGPGYRQSRITAGEQQNEVIGHLESEFYYEITTYTSFKQGITIASSPKNTKTHTINELRTALFGPIAAKISFEMEHYERLPPNSKFSRKTDATTKVTLSYNF